MLKTFASIFYLHIAISIVCALIAYISILIAASKDKAPVSQEELEEQQNMLEGLVSNRFGINLSTMEILAICWFIPFLNVGLAIHFVQIAKTYTD